MESLLEKASKAISKDKAEKLAKKVIKGDFTLEDLYEQMGAMKDVGSLSQIASMIPGLGTKIPKGVLESQQKKMENWKYLMDSMTPQEKANPEILKQDRIARIAKGSGRSEQEVRELLAQYKKMKKMMKGMGGIMNKIPGLGGQSRQLKKLLRKGGF